MDNNRTDQEHTGFDVYVLTWVTLLILTAITVTVAGMHLGKLSVLVAVVVATVKAGVVLYFFMHLKYESALFKIMVYVALGTLMIFVGLTFFDILFR
ncbi:MAG: cytochrome C oxidase subunit IV family protein [Candidatus Latescibacterota bacterium]|nr:MAG: cytochrome C oxidase subunit IV family protein [Candidatus Latescibacterota bacterium]